MSHESILPDILVTTAWLAEHRHDPAIRVVDIRGYVRTTDLGGGAQHAEYIGAFDEYQNGHVPNAVFVDWTSDIVDPEQPVKAQVASPAQFAAAMAERGIGNETDVVIVDHTGGNFATRLWWALRYFGHDRAAVLDGGFNTWRAEGRPIDATPAVIPRATFEAKPRTELLANAAEVLSAISRTDTVIVDARDIGQFSGAIRRGTRGGHIPAAVHVPAKSLVNGDGTWKATSELHALIKASGIEPDERVIAYCNGGVTATALLFALHRTGHHNYANYDGSWNEWGERMDLPVETGIVSPDTK